MCRFNSLKSCKETFSVPSCKDILFFILAKLELFSAFCCRSFFCRSGSSYFFSLLSSFSGCQFSFLFSYDFSFCLICFFFSFQTSNGGSFCSFAIFVLYCLNRSLFVFQPSLKLSFSSGFVECTLLNTFQ